MNPGVTYIVHPGTGTVLLSSECVTVTIPGDVLDGLTGDDYFDDVTVCEWAERCGVNVETVIPLSVTRMLIDAVAAGDIDAVDEIVTVHGWDENASDFYTTGGVA